MEWLNTNTIIKVLAGSRGYGTFTDTSDFDYRGICIPPKEIYYGLQHFDQYEANNEDIVIYGFNRFIDLALKNNPNILEILFSDESKIEYINSYGQRLRDIRYEFLSKLCFKTYCGYASAQIHRMVNHKTWIDNPVKKPIRSELGLPENPKMPLHIIQGLIGVKFDLLLPKIREYVSRELSYLNSKKEWDKYNNWVKNRNPDRAELERKVGYDTKHYMHCIRLLRTGIEVLRDRELRVLRPDADELRGIRNCELSYDEAMKLYSELDTEIYKAYEKSELPEKPNYKKINRFLINMVIEFHENS